MCRFGSCGIKVRNIWAGTYILIFLSNRLVINPSTEKTENSKSAPQGSNVSWTFVEPVKARVWYLPCMRKPQWQQPSSKHNTNSYLISTKAHPLSSLQVTDSPETKSPSPITPDSTLHSTIQNRKMPYLLPLMNQSHPMKLFQTDSTDKTTKTPKYCDNIGSRTASCHLLISPFFFIR